MYKYLQSGQLCLQPATKNLFSAFLLKVVLFFFFFRLSTFSENLVFQLVTSVLKVQRRNAA